MTDVDRMQRNALLLLLALWVGLGAWVLAPTDATAAPPQQEEGYRTIRDAPSKIVTGEAAADSVDVSVPLATTGLRAPKETRGNPTAAVDVEFSNVAGTAVITCVIWHYDRGADSWTRMGIQQATATATTSKQGAAGNYVAKTLYFDTSSGTHYGLRHAAPNAGTVDMTAWSYGVYPE